MKIVPCGRVIDGEVYVKTKKGWVNRTTGKLIKKIPEELKGMKWD